MGKAEEGRSGLVDFPDDPRELETRQIQECLRDAGFSSEDQDWLLRVLARPDCFGSTARDAAFKEGFVDSFEVDLPLILERADPKVRQTCLTLLFGFMLNCGPRHYSEGLRPSFDGSWASEFRRHAGFCARSLDWRTLAAPKKDSFQFAKLIPHLFSEGLPLAQVVNLDALHAVKRTEWSSSDFRDPETLEFWLIWRFRKEEEHRDTVNLRTLLPAFVDLPPEVLGKKLLGLLNAIGYALNMASATSTAGLDHLNRGWRVVAHELIPFLELLHEKQPHSHREPSILLKAWWALAVQVHGPSMGGLGEDLSPERRDRLVDSAARHFGLLRKVLRESPEHFVGQDCTGQISDFYHEAFRVLLIFAPPWKRLKPLLLILAEMTKPAVASDLRPWPEPDRDDPPLPYSQIPLWIGIAMYPQNLQDEIKRDPKLQSLREEFAAFCLGRLKTKKPAAHAGADFVEPRPYWRQCYVQALAALRVNPAGRAHRTVFWLLNNDPDETVRAYAKKAHKRIRHLDRKKPNLDDGASPRRPLFEAFWWLRQAHLLALGEEIDDAGAMRTRRKELQRTREKEDRLHWQT